MLTSYHDDNPASRHPGHPELRPGPGAGCGGLQPAPWLHRVCWRGRGLRHLRRLRRRPRPPPWRSAPALAQRALQTTPAPRSTHAQLPWPRSRACCVQTILFTPPLTLIVGANGCGKTTVIEVGFLRSQLGLMQHARARCVHCLMACLTFLVLLQSLRMATCGVLPPNSGDVSPCVRTRGARPQARRHQRAHR